MANHERITAAAAFPARGFAYTGHAASRAGPWVDGCPALFAALRIDWYQFWMYTSPQFREKKPYIETRENPNQSFDTVSRLRTMLRCAYCRGIEWLRREASQIDFTAL